MIFKTALVVGEHCYDNYIVGSVSRLNPEAPSPILTGPFSKRIMDGMASNVAANITALGDMVVRAGNETAIIKTRYCDKVSGYILLRVDEADTAPRIKEHELEKLLSLIRKKCVDYVVISDYNKGYLQTSDIEVILHCAFDNGIPTFLDTKKILGKWSKEAFVVKINKKEFLENMQKDMNESYGKYLVVTQGGDQILKFTKGQSSPKAFDIKSSQVINVCGAGDSVLAGLAFNYAQSNDIDKAIEFGARCGTIACKYFGTHTFNKSDLTDLGIIK